MATRTEMRVSGTQGAVVTLSMCVNDCPSCGVIFVITTMARRRLYDTESRVVEWDEECQLKPTADATCVVVDRTIRVSEGEVTLWWYADEGAEWNDLLRWADEDDDV